VGFVVDKVVVRQVYPCQFHSTGAPLHGKTKNLITFITGLHNKPQGCGASAARTFTTKKETVVPQPSMSRSLTIHLGVTAASGEDVEDPSKVFTVGSYRLPLGNDEVLIAVYKN
jgi:hypothetical protein